MASKDEVYWERYDDLEIGLEAAKIAGMSVTGTSERLGLRLVGTPKQEAIYRREYDRLMNGNGKK